MSIATAPADPAGAPSSRVLWRVLVPAVLLPAEVLFVTALFDARPLAATPEGGIVPALLGHAALAVRCITAFAVLWLMLAARRLPRYVRALADRPSGSSLPLVAAHAGSFVLFVAAASRLFPDAAGVLPAANGTLTLVWLLAGLGVMATWATWLAPARWWFALLYRDRRRLPLLAGAAIVATVLAEWAQDLWNGLATTALQAARILLELVYDGVRADPVFHRLGLGDFTVTVGPQCSGLEGMALMGVVTATYLYVYRREFRFPAALALLPLGIAAIWCFNALRIALLVAIGAAGAPELALGGFHSQAGWIAFIVVSATMLYGAHRLGFARADRRAPGRRRLTPAAAMLLPLLVVLGTGLVTAAVTTAIDWLYPLRLLTGFLALAWCWRVLDMQRPGREARPYLVAVLVGVAVAAVWILATRSDPNIDAAVSGAWQTQGDAIAWTWLGLRVMGAVTLIPVVEELAFRGYLLARLDGSPPRPNAPLVAGWPALLGSSVLFGVLHDAWVAGVLSGIAFGLMRRLGGLWPVIGAHALANALLAFYVGFTGHWSVW